MKHVVFVDFDGVLTSQRLFRTLPEDSYEMWCQFDPVVMQFFNKIHWAFQDVRFVWTTTWRDRIEKNFYMEHIAYSLWYNAGFRGKFGEPWCVNPNDENMGTSGMNRRAYEILHYLQNYAPNTNDFLVLDDVDFQFNSVLPKKRFVKTDADDGMLSRHYTKAWQLIGHWEKR